jgi:YebC/PmpR family DNA-binding regulatory protein
MIECLTDNKNRTVADLRYILSKQNGSLGENGCVSWMFDQKGYIVIEKTETDEETLMDVALEAGAEDVTNDPEEPNFEVITAPQDFEAVRAAIEAKGIPMAAAEVTRLPQTFVKLEGKEAAQMLRLMDGLDDCDDTQNVYANFDIPDDMMDED